MFLFTTPPTRAAAPATPVVDAIREGAERTGVGFDYLLATAKRESALNPAAKAPTSSASGLFQFIEQTWLGLMKSEGPKAGLPDLAQSIATRSDGTHRVDDPTTRQAILDLRQDPKVASVMAGALTQKNREALTADLGREPTATDLYAAHFLGARGAIELIRAAERSPDQPLASIFPEAAAANRSIFYDRQGRARGAGEVYALLSQHHGATTAAPAFAPDRPVAFATPDGPAFHALFQSEGRRGPISEAVAKLWQTGRTDSPRADVTLSYFPNSAGGSIQEREAPAEVTGLPATALPASAPLPPRRPGGAPPGQAPRPLDLSSFMRRAGA
jgi:hypothetical protein